MGDELLDRDVHLLALLQEGHGLGVVLSGVVPRADDVDLLVAHSEVGVDGVLAVVDEEAHLAHTATAADVGVDVSGGDGSAGALEGEVNTNTVGHGLNLGNALVEGVLVGTLEADGGLGTHLLSDLQSVLVTVHSNDVVDTGGAENGDHHQTHGAAALHQNLGAEVQKTGLLASLQSVDANAGQLQDHALVEVQLVDLEEGRAGGLTTADEHVVSEPTVGTVALVGTSLVTDQAENALVGAEVGATGGHAAVVTIAAGPASVYDFDAEVLVNGKPVLDPKTKRNKTEKKQYLAFPAVITHSDGTTDRNYKVSVRTLVTPSIATELQEGKLYRSSLRHRFGKGDVTFRDVTTPNGKSVQLPVLEEDIVCTIAVGNCYAQPFGAEADYDRENKCWNNPVTMENYGYAEA